MIKKEFIEAIKSVLFVDGSEEAEFVVFNYLPDDEEVYMESSGYDEDEDGNYQTWTLDIDEYEPREYTREDGTDDEIAEALAEDLINCGFPYEDCIVEG